MGAQRVRYHYHLVAQTEPYCIANCIERDYDKKEICINALASGCHFHLHFLQREAVLCCINYYHSSPHRSDCRVAITPLGCSITWGH